LLNTQFARTEQHSAVRTGHVFGRHDLIWRGNVLRAGGVTLAEIKPDPVWPGMWRVVLPATPAEPDGRITGMVNLSRARPQHKTARRDGRRGLAPASKRSGIA
jgi:hypothetical protein